MTRTTTNIAAADALLLLSASPARAGLRRRPRVFEDLSAAPLEVVAVAEFVLGEHGQHTAQPLLKDLLAPAARRSALPSPMRGKREIGAASRVAEADLNGLWRHISRDGANTNAAHHRTALLADITARRTAELEGMRVPAAVSAVIRRRSIWAWFPRLDDDEETEEEEEEEEEEDPSEGTIAFRCWLRARQATWRAAWPNTRVHMTLRAERRRWRDAHYTPGSEIQPLPPCVHWMEPHPQNHQAWLSDEAAAGLRHKMAETRCSGRSLPLSFALDYAIVFREPPPPLAVLSRATLRHAFMRLHLRDVLDLGEFVRDVLDEFEAAMIYHVFDDTPDGKCERHAHLVSIWDPEVKSPRFLFLSCKGTPDKTAEGNAAENLLNLELLGDVDANRHGGCTCDHAALRAGGRVRRAPRGGCGSAAG